MSDKPRGAPRQTFTVQHIAGNGSASVVPLGVRPETPAPVDESFDPSKHTIADVKAHIEDGNADQVEAILEAERAQGDDARTSLIDWLESQLDG